MGQNTNHQEKKSLTDHAGIKLVNSSWHKTPNELNCRLHPSNTAATKTRAALKQCEHDVAGERLHSWKYCSTNEQDAIYILSNPNPKMKKMMTSVE